MGLGWSLYSSFQIQTIPWPRPPPKADGDGVESKNASLGQLLSPILDSAELVYSIPEPSCFIFMRPRVLPPGSCPEHPQPGANTHRDAAENVSELLSADDDWGSVLASAISPIFIALFCSSWSLPGLRWCAVLKKVDRVQIHLLNHEEVKRLLLPLGHGQTSSHSKDCYPPISEAVTWAVRPT